VQNAILGLRIGPDEFPRAALADDELFQTILIRALLFWRYSIVDYDGW
jgi:hypothetical protein